MFISLARNFISYVIKSLLHTPTRLNRAGWRGKVNAAVQLLRSASTAKNARRDLLQVLRSFNTGNYDKDI
jgi:hypothetical protein